MLTGLRAIDLKGRIIYVNHAFCELVGWSAEELIGQNPPFPYWPDKDHDQNWRKLQICLAGDAPAEGMELRVRRRNGSCGMCACTFRHWSTPTACRPAG